MAPKSLPSPNRALAQLINLSPSEIDEQLSKIEERISQGAPLNAQSVRALFPEKIDKLYAPQRQAYLQMVGCVLKIFTQAGFDLLGAHSLFSEQELGKRGLPEHNLLELLAHLENEGELVLRTRSGGTPLHRLFDTAAGVYSIAMVPWELLVAKSWTTATDELGNTAFHKVWEGGRAGCIHRDVSMHFVFEKFQKLGFDLSRRNNAGLSTAHLMLMCPGIEVFLEAHDEYQRLPQGSTMGKLTSVVEIHSLEE